MKPHPDAQALFCGGPARWIPLADPLTGGREATMSDTRMQARALGRRMYDPPTG